MRSSDNRTRPDRDMGFVAKCVLREAATRRHGVHMTTRTVATGQAEGTPTSARPHSEATQGRHEPTLAELDPTQPVLESAPEAATAAARTGNLVAEPQVTAMFDEIAPVYDRMNTLMTLGADRRWRRAAVEAAGLSSGGSVIDVACGTGKLAAALAERVGPFGRVLAVDLSTGMIAHGAQANYDLVQLEFRIGNALDLPASDAEFDAATIAFGLRNLADYEV